MDFVGTNNNPFAMESAVGPCARHGILFL